MELERQEPTAIETDLELPETQEYRIPNYDHIPTSVADTSIAVFVRSALKLSRRSRRWARLYKGVDVTGSILLLLLAAVITFFSLGDSVDKTTAQYISGIMGIVVGLIEGSKRVFNFTGRGTVFEQISNKAFFLSQKAKQLVVTDMSEEELLYKLNCYYLKLGKLDSTAYDASATTLHSSGDSGVRQSGRVSLSGIGDSPRFKLGAPNTYNPALVTS